MQRDAAVWSRHVVVGLTEHGVKTVQGHVLREQAMSQPVDFHQPFKLLKHTGTKQFQFNEYSKVLSQSSQDVQMGKKIVCMFVIPKNTDYDDNKYQNSLKA